jgi:CRP-like cAMP-binding protein
MSVEAEPQLKILSMAKCLHGFGPHDLKQIISISSKATWSKGVNVFMEGDKGRDMFIVCSGTIFIWRGHGKTRVKLATLSAGDSLGEMGLVGEGRRRAGAQAVEDTVALRISYEGLQKVPSTAFLLFRNIAGALAERLTTANDVIFQSKLDALAAAPPAEATDEDEASE